MADVIKILADIKGKALDAVHFELLKSAYELQNQNIEQLKNNNMALKENNDFLKEKNARLENEKRDLRQQIVTTKALLKTQPNKDQQEDVSEVAKAILRKCIERDETEFSDLNMLRCLSFSKIEIKAALGELSHKGIIRLGSSNMYSGEANYYLTQKGKEFVLKLKK